MQSQAGAAFDRKFAKLLRDAVEALTLREEQEKEMLIPSWKENICKTCVRLCQRLGRRTQVE